ncbi:DNA primase [Burkholderia pseudomultivorans]|uniref:LPD7 domain-containing protein n=1 Tax=Burkholderia pseudomultivorans TaxID=1207504 RepID=UPI002876E3B5|nr:LPD7 domain-containing protein [Burkholderia pseudomultivorans]MDS0862211.1 DNA primase [Burkholderia pseudomultivorans]
MAQTTSAQEADPVINVIEQDGPGNSSGPVPSNDRLEPLDSAAMDAVSARRRREFDAARARLRGQAMRDDRSTSRSTEASAAAEPPGVPDRGRAPLDQPPERVRKRYLRAGNQYFLKDAPYQLAFEDLGPYLVTGHNRPDVIESMVDMAHAKSWQRIRVSGHEAFRSEVWLQATLLGIDVSGYEPKAADLARLADARQARLDNRIDVAADVTAVAASGAQGRGDPGSVPVAARPGATGVAANGTLPAAPRHDAASVPRATAVRNPAGDEPDAPRRYAGQLLEHGSAPYLHNPARSDSYYVVFRDQAGVDQAVWGVDLERAVRESGAGTGQQVVLENLGKRLVTVRIPVFDGLGNVVGEEDKDVYRNTWQVEVAQRGRDASASPELDNRPDGDARSVGSRAAPATGPEMRRRRAVQRPESDPAMHLAVLATAMREQGFSDRSIARVRQRAERLLVAFGKDGTPVPTPKVFDPKAPSGRDQRRRSSPERAPAPEIDRTPAEPSLSSPSR